jgi:glycosyltransferase involved in cell wall biosynthesis
MISKELSVIFPIYNEQETIKETLLEWRNTLDKLQINYEIILAEDGSTDNTKDILIDLLINNRDLFVSNIEDKKRGYANAIRSSVKIAKGKYILNVDSDGQCDPKDFINFWKKRDHLENSIIIGHRYNRKDSLQRLLMSKFFLILHRVLFFSRVKDPSCPYILSKNEFFVKINPYLKFMVEGFWWGFVAICLKKNIQIYQVKINHRLRLSGQTNVFHLNKIPSIALRNIYGLIKLRFLKIN